MSDVSGIPNMGFGGGNFFAPQFSYNPQMSAGQASAAYMPAENYAQNVTNNLFSSGGGFGKQTDYYSQLGSNYIGQIQPMSVGLSGLFDGTYPEAQPIDWGSLPPSDVDRLYPGGGGGSGGTASPMIDWSNFQSPANNPNTFQSGWGNVSNNLNLGAGGTPEWSTLFPSGGSSGGGGGLDWTHIFDGGAKADPAPGMATPGGLGSPMTTPQQTAEPQQQQQPGINWGNVGAAAGAGSTMPYTSGIEPDMTGGRTLTGDAAPTAMPQQPQQQTTEPSAPASARTYDVKPTVESGGTGGTASQAPTYGSYGGNVFGYIQPGETQDTSKSASAIAEEARQRLAGIIGSPETAKAVAKAEAPGSMRDFVSPEQGYGKFQQPGAAALSDLSNLPPEFPDFTKLYPEYRGGAPASAGEPATDRLGNPLRPEMDPPRPSADIFPAARLAPNGKEPELFVVHHTSGRSDPASIVADWRDGPRREDHIGAQYIMDRNGVVHDTLAEYGYSGTNQAKDIAVPGSGVSKADTGNRNIVGMEIVAKDAKDVTPAQQAALVQFANERYPNTPFYGHGEISTNKESNEGVAGAQAVLASRPAPFNFDWSNAPIPGPANERPASAPTSSYGPLATQNASAADTPAEAVPLPRARPAAANIAQANSVLDSKILDLVQKNSPSNVDRIPSSIANQTLREALGNSMTGGLIRSGLTPYLPQMGVSQAEFDKAYAGGQPAQPPRAAGGVPEDDSWTPQENTPKWNTDVYQPALGGGVQHRDETASDLRWSDFARPGNVENRTGEQLGRDQLAALRARGSSFVPDPEVASSPLGAALGLGDLPTPRDMAAAAARPQSTAPASRFFGDDQGIANQPLAPGELNDNWNKLIYEATDRPTMARNESLGADPNPFTNFRQSPNVDDRRFDPQLTDAQREANPYTGGKWTFDPKDPVPEGGSMGEALGTRQIDNLEANVIAQRMAGQGAGVAPRAAGTDGADVFGPSSSAFDLSPGGFGEGGYGNAFTLGSGTANTPPGVNPYQGPTMPSWQANIPPAYRTPEVTAAIEAQARQLGIPPEAIVGVAQIEGSGWNPQYTTGSQAGVFQIAPDDFKTAGGKLGGLTYAQYRNASPAQQVAAYGDYIRSSPNAAYLDYAHGDPALTAAIMQGIQLSPQSGAFTEALKSGNADFQIANDPKGRAPFYTGQADALRYTTINDMRNAFARVIAGFPQTQTLSGGQ